MYQFYIWFIYHVLELIIYLFIYSYYPLYPSSEDVNIDYELFEQYAKLPVTPHVLIIPSELRYFIKVGGNDL